MTVLTLLLVAATWVLLTLLPGNLTPASWLGNLNLYLHHQLQSLRGPVGDTLLVAFTGLGSGWVLYSFTAMMCVWLLWQRHWRITLHWLIAVAGVTLMTAALQSYTMVERPSAADTLTMGYGFPSAPAAVSIAVFGFLAVAIARELRSNWHWLPYSSAVFLIVAISFSQLYLGAQWFSDILGGWSLGLVWVALLGIAYRQHPAESISAAVFAPVALASLLLAAVTYHAQRFEQDLALYTPQPGKQVTIDRQAWIADVWRVLPVYRDDFAGRHTQPMDVQWLASREQIETYLQGRGWRTPPSADGTGLLDLFKSGTDVNELPVLPQVHRGEKQQVLLVRPAAKPGRLLTLRLWRSQYRSATDESLWIGNVSHLSVDDHLRLLRFLRTDPDYADALKDFLADIEPLSPHGMPLTPPPSDMRGILWPDRVLLIGGG